MLGKHLVILHETFIYWGCKMKAYNANKLTGCTTGSIDSIDDANSGDVAFICLGTFLYSYIFDATAFNGEHDGFLMIRPEGGGVGAWGLKPNPPG